MKKIFLFIPFVLLLCGALFAESLETSFWQTVSLGDCVTMKIPQDWQCIEEDGLIYILNEKSEPIMIEYVPSDEPSSNKYFSNFYRNNLYPRNHLSSAICGLASVIYGEEFKDMRYFSSDCLKHRKEFIVWDTSLTEKEFVKIVKTVETNH